MKFQGGSTESLKMLLNLTSDGKNEICFLCTDAVSIRNMHPSSPKTFRDHQKPPTSVNIVNEWPINFDIWLNSECALDSSYEIPSCFRFVKTFPLLLAPVSFKGSRKHTLIKFKIALFSYSQSVLFILSIYVWQIIIFHIVLVISSLFQFSLCFWYSMAWRKTSRGIFRKNPAKRPRRLFS